MKKYFWLWSTFLCILGILVIFARTPNLPVSAASKFSLPTISFPGFGGAAAAPAAQTCASGWVYDNLTVVDYPVVQVGPTYADYNGTNHEETDVFSLDVHRRVAFAVDRAFTVSTTVVLAAVAEFTNRHVEQSIEVEATDATTVTVPPYHTGYAQYGVREIETRGHYYYQAWCHILVDTGYMISWCPWYAGWNTWIEGSDQPDKKKSS